MGTSETPSTSPRTGEQDGPSASPDLESDQQKDLYLDEWKDFEYEPIKTAPVLTINVSDEFRHVFGLLYAVKKTEERSKRVLHLTSRAIRLSPANPTAWMLRRETVIAQASDIPNIWTVELAFSAKVISQNRKNYQAWEHRRFAAEAGKLLQSEIEFTDVILNDDEKNYHAWSHRQWLVREHKVTEGELDATQWFIHSDLRNNSAWNHRWLVTGLIEGARSEAELKFALDFVEKAPRNEAVWNYIHALGKSGVSIHKAKEKAVECLEVDAGCIPARRFLVLCGTEADAADVQRHCDLLASGLDPIRTKYWQAQSENAAKQQSR